MEKYSRVGINRKKKELTHILSYDSFKNTSNSLTRGQQNSHPIIILPFLILRLDCLLGSKGLAKWKKKSLIKSCEEIVMKDERNTKEFQGNTLQSVDVGRCLVLLSTWEIQK